MITREQIEKTTAEWTADNPVLSADVIGIEVTTTGYNRFKRGDGVTEWSALPYLDKIPPTEEAAKIASNFMEYSIENGLLIGDRTTGSFVGYRAQVLSDAINILDDSGNIVACFKKGDISFDADIGLTGRIRGQSSGGNWDRGRDNALLASTNNDNAEAYYPVVDIKSDVGDWSMGVLNDSLYFVFTQDSDYSAGNNVVNKLGIRYDGMPLLNGSMPLIEYGTWTPTIYNRSGSNPTVTYKNRSGYYYRIGNMVYVIAYISPVISANSGNYAAVSGLPFASYGIQQGLEVFEGYNVFDHGNSAYHVTAHVISGTGDVHFYSPTGAASLNWIVNSGETTYNPNLRFSGWYRIA